MTAVSREAAEYLIADAKFWRERAEQMQAAMIVFATEMGRCESVPPEPPVGTTFLADDGTVRLRHEVDGWHCANTQCRNCPDDGWEGMWSWMPSQIGRWTRVLPGGGA